MKHRVAAFFGAALAMATIQYAYMVLWLWGFPAPMSQWRNETRLLVTILPLVAGILAAALVTVPKKGNDTNG